MRGAAIAVWCDYTGDDAEFEAWFTTEHAHERLALPGMGSAHLYAAANPAVPARGRQWFLCYELESVAAMTSEEYRTALNHPSPWSSFVVPRMAAVTRLECEVLASRGELPDEVVTRVDTGVATRDALSSPWHHELRVVGATQPTYVRLVDAAGEAALSLGSYRRRFQLAAQGTGSG